MKPTLGDLHQAQKHNYLKDKGWVKEGAEEKGGNLQSVDPLRLFTIKESIIGLFMSKSPGLGFVEGVGQCLDLIQKRLVSINFVIIRLSKA